MHTRPESSLRRLVQKSQIRARIVAVADGMLAYALFAGLGVVAVGALSASELVGTTPAALALGLLVVAGGFYVLHVARRGTDTLSIARRLDGRFGTAERLSTALSVSVEQAGRSAFAAAQLAETERAAAGELRTIALPWEAPRHLRSMALAVALCALAAGPHGLAVGSGRVIPPPRARAAATAADLLGRDLPALETAAEGAGLRKLARRVERLKRVLEEDLEKLEEPDLKLWEIPPDARAHVMPHEEDAPKPGDLADKDKIPLSPAVGGAAAAALAATGVAGYAPVGKFDAGPVDETDEAAFAELDAKLLKDSTLTPEKLMDLAKRVELVSKSLHNFGEDYGRHGDTGDGGDSVESGRPGAPDPDVEGRMAGAKPPNSWNAEASGLAMKAWGEFLRKYSFKLKEGALKGALAKAARDAEKDKKAGKPEISVDLPASKVKLTDLEKLRPAAAPKKGASTMDVGAMGEMGKKLAAAALKEGEKTDARKGPEMLGDKTAVGGSGAGKGASDEEKKMDFDPEKAPDEDDAAMSSITGSLGEGESDITVIRDFSKFAAGAESPAAYKEIFAGAVKTASGALDNGSVPPELKEYVRLYFNAIRPR